MDKRDTTITVTAYLKSVIESGAKKDDWETLTKEALRIHYRLVNHLTQEVKK
jgi:hypothetical protein